MKQETKNKLFEAWAYCDAMDKSTEYILCYMADQVENEDFDESNVIDFMLKESFNRKLWYRTNPDWYKKYDLNKT